MKEKTGKKICSLPDGKNISDFIVGLANSKERDKVQMIDFSTVENWFPSSYFFSLLSGSSCLA